MGRPRLILLVRHGESEGNCDRSVNQYIANHKIPLTEKGHRQAEKAGNNLRELLQPEDDICFYTSPYLRTRQTLQGIITGIKDSDVKYRVFEEPRMREQDFGNFQGTSAEMKEIWVERAKYGHFFYRIPHGESAADVYDRCASFNETLFRQFSKDSFPSILVLVTHGIWTRVFLQKWFRWSVEEFEDLQNVPHCSWIVLEKNEDTGRYKLNTKLATWSELKEDCREEKLKEDTKEEMTFNTRVPVGDEVAQVVDAEVKAKEEQAKKSMAMRAIFMNNNNNNNNNTSESKHVSASYADDDHEDSSCANKV